MSPKPHSKTVRGTFDNPKTQAAIKSDQSPPQLGDPTSLKPEHVDRPLPSNDSAPPHEQGNDAKSYPGSPTVSDPYNKNENKSSKQKNDLPHSKKVRGTLANTDGKSVNKTQLGDPVSLKAETSKTELDKKTEREGQTKSKL